LAISSLLLPGVSKTYNPAFVSFQSAADSQTGVAVNKNLAKKDFDSPRLLADDRSSKQLRVGTKGDGDARGYDSK
jgi:hypothetical protein